MHTYTYLHTLSTQTIQEKKTNTKGRIGKGKWKYLIFVVWTTEPGNRKQRPQLVSIHPVKDKESRPQICWYIPVPEKAPVFALSY